jgi:hypothetical protein
MQLFRVRQNWPRPRVDEVSGEVNRQLAALSLGDIVRPGRSVAVAVGSRGISQIAEIARAVVQHLQSIGAKPFIVPAMGSHGGATAEGQRRILESYGVTEKSCGCPIRASMETIVAATAVEGFPIHFDRLAAEADHVVLCARVKPHTTFTGRIESGLMKMLLVGLGKCDGARVFHRAVYEASFEQIVRGVGAQVLERMKILAGVAVVENAYNEIGKLVAVRPGDFAGSDEQLLGTAIEWLPRLPFDFAHVLIVDEIGKDISGTGMDTNVIGRKEQGRDAEIRRDGAPEIRRIIVRGLSPGTHGSAHGAGLADFCKSRIVRAADLNATWTNGLISGQVHTSMFPIHFDTDRELLDAALSIAGLVEPPNAKVMWIKNTKELTEIECSTPYLEEAQRRNDLEIIAGPCEAPFDAEGNLPAFPHAGN